MITLPDPYPNLMKWPVVETVYVENLYPQFQTVHIEDVELSMVAIQLLAVDVFLYDRASCRCKILRNRVLTGNLYSDMTSTIEAIAQTYDPPSPEPLPTPV